MYRISILPVDPYSASYFFLSIPFSPSTPDCMAKPHTTNVQWIQFHSIEATLLLSDFVVFSADSSSSSSSVGWLVGRLMRTHLPFNINLLMLPGQRKQNIHRIAGDAVRQPGVDEIHFFFSLRAVAIVYSELLSDSSVECSVVGTALQKWASRRMKKRRRRLAFKHVNTKSGKCRICSFAECCFVLF